MLGALPNAKVEPAAGAGAVDAVKPLVAVAPNADMAAVGALVPNAFEVAAAVLPPELAAGAALPPNEKPPPEAVGAAAPKAEAA